MLSIDKRVIFAAAALAQEAVAILRSKPVVGEETEASFWLLTSCRLFIPTCLATMREGREYACPSRQSFSDSPPSHPDGGRFNSSVLPLIFR